MSANKTAAYIIGGSAGAIDALMEILPTLPKERTFPVIIILHLLPRGPSLLPAIFKVRCPWPVKDAESTEPIENGIVYFAPADYHLSIEADRTFSLSTEEPIMFSRPSIDLFFQSAAPVYKGELVALLLSGANSDGANGFREILRHGGRCLIQALETAEFPEMPRAGLEISPAVTAIQTTAAFEFLNGRK
jgi:two-component system chemotaxis response regulator CheB